MYDVLLVALMAIFPVLLYLFIKWVGWLEFRRRTLPDLRMRMDAIRDTLEAHVVSEVEPGDPVQAAAIRKAMAADRAAFSEAARVGSLAYLFRRPGLERSLEAQVREASARSRRVRGVDPEIPQAAGAQAPGAQAAGIEAPGIEAPGAQAPGTEVPGTEVPGTEVPVSGAPDGPGDSARP